MPPAAKHVYQKQNSFSSKRKKKHFFFFNSNNQQKHKTISKNTRKKRPAWFFTLTTLPHTECRHKNVPCQFNAVVEYIQNCRCRTVLPWQEKRKQAAVTSDTWKLLSSMLLSLVITCTFQLNSWEPPAVICGQKPCLCRVVTGSAFPSPPQNVYLPCFYRAYR